MSDNPKMKKLVLTVDAALLEHFAEELDVLVNEAKVNIGPTGWGARVVDPAHIGMGDIRIPRASFLSWRAIPTKARSAEFGVDVDKLLSYTKRLGQEDAPELTIDFEAHKMMVSSSRGIRTSGLLDTTGMSEPKEPPLNLPCRVKVRDQAGFLSALKEAGEISDHVRIRYNPKKRQLWLSSESDMDKIELLVPHRLLKMTGDAGEVTSLFPLEYFVNTVSVLPDDFIMDLGNDYPVRLSFERASYLLAPRIESGD